MLFDPECSAWHLWCELNLPMLSHCYLNLSHTSEYFFYHWKLHSSSWLWSTCTLSENANFWNQAEFSLLKTPRPPPTRQYLNPLTTTALLCACLLRFRPNSDARIGGQQEQWLIELCLCCWQKCRFAALLLWCDFSPLFRGNSGVRV